jgi:hypothetical protein
MSSALELFQLSVLFLLGATEANIILLEPHEAIEGVLGVRGEATIELIGERE